MKKVLATMGLAVLASPMANAGSLGFDFKSEFVNTSYNDAAGTPNNSVFKVSRFDLNIGGKLGEMTSYTARIKLLNSNAKAYATIGATTSEVSPNDGTTSFIDAAYVTRTLMDGLELSVGKVWTGIHGWEGNLSGADVYLYTVAGDTFAGAGAATGANLGYKMGDHTFNVMVTNPNTNMMSTTTAPNQDRNMWGVTYFGNLMGGMLLPVVTYHMDDQTVGSAKKKFSYLGLGGKFAMEMFDIEADILMNNLEGNTTADKTDTVSSYYLLARYKMGAFMPHLKYEISTAKINTSATVETKTDYTGLTAALEYLPVDNEMFRYHVAYTRRTEKADTSGAQEKATDKLMFGVRLNADILK